MRIDSQIFRVLRFVAVLVFVQSSLLLAQDVIRVAVFDGDGVGKSVGEFVETLKTEGGERVQIQRVTPEEIRSGKLQGVDILVQPGGSGSRQGKALGEEGRTAVRNFVQKGGGYLGVCAGSYLATNDYDWSLNLIDAKVVDRRHWARGKGLVLLKLSPEGAGFFDQASNELEIYYAQGPLLGRPEWDDDKVPDYQSLAIFDSEIAEKGAPSGIMRGTSAIVRGDYGNGRVFCFSPHPELSDQRGFMITKAVEWLVQSDR